VQFATAALRGGRKMQWVKSVEGMIDFLSVVIVHAPDDFPEEDFLGADEQLTLDRAFGELRYGMSFVKTKIKDKLLLDRLDELLEESFSAYKLGDDVKGAHLLQDFEKIVLEPC
jgi:hypothetical protein